MERLNLTLDTDTAIALEKHARVHGKPRGAFARELLREGLDRRDARERRRKLAKDYALGRQDARDLLAELEALQLDLFGDTDEEIE